MDITRRCRHWAGKSDVVFDVSRPLHFRNFLLRQESLAHGCPVFGNISNLVLSGSCFSPQVIAPRFSFVSCDDVSSFLSRRGGGGVARRRGGQGCLTEMSKRQGPVALVQQPTWIILCGLDSCQGSYFPSLGTRSSRQQFLPIADVDCLSSEPCLLPRG